MPYSPIEDYALIGNMHTAALVGRNGSIDFMCYPHFDSPSILAAMLDDQKGGRFQIRTILHEGRQRQLYVPDTSVLLSRFLSEDGVAEISDFMPLGQGSDPHWLVRRAKTVRGEVKYELKCEPRFNCAQDGYRVELGDAEALLISNDLKLRLRSDVPLSVTDDGAVVAEFTLGTGKTASFVLEQVPESGESRSDSAGYIPNAFKETLDFWCHWISKTTIRAAGSIHQPHRSALALYPARDRAGSG